MAENASRILQGLPFRSKLWLREPGTPCHHGAAVDGVAALAPSVQAAANARRNWKAARAYEAAEGIVGCCDAPSNDPRESARLERDLPRRGRGIPFANGESSRGSADD